MRLETQMSSKPLAWPGAARKERSGLQLHERARKRETQLPCLIFGLRLESTPTTLYLARRRQ